MAHQTPLLIVVHHRNLIMSTTWNFDRQCCILTARFGGTARLLQRFTVAQIVILLCRYVYTYLKWFLMLRPKIVMNSEFCAILDVCRVVNVKVRFGMTRLNCFIICLSFLSSHHTMGKWDVHKVSFCHDLARCFVLVFLDYMSVLSLLSPPHG